MSFREVSSRPRWGRPGVDPCRPLYARHGRWRPALHLRPTPVPAEGSLCRDKDFETQARENIANMLAILKAGGGGPRDLLKVTAYIVGVSNWPRFNAVYAALLPDARPARIVVPVTELHHGSLVGIDAIAMLPH
ncbi:RidA family protein [Mesorhizobium sp. BR1-1-6]|uniref:RidA family protein n=1 Tax=unclassified Mesorhizobium TaxID=325217 RepID=UPI002961F861|nr:RidA family protein [Mesorhizobium sp. BR1-1-6]